MLQGNPKQIRYKIWRHAGELRRNGLPEGKRVLLFQRACIPRLDRRNLRHAELVTAFLGFQAQGLGEGDLGVPSDGGEAQHTAMLEVLGTGLRHQFRSVQGKQMPEIRNRRVREAEGVQAASQNGKVHAQHREAGHQRAHFPEKWAVSYGI